MYTYETRKPSGRLRIAIDAYFASPCSGNIQYVVRDVQMCPKGKRKFVSVAADIRDRYEYRLLDQEARSKYALDEFLKHCTHEDISAALNYAYEQMKHNNTNVSIRVS